MTFFKPPGRQSDIDAGRFFGSATQAAADRAADPFFAGQQAFWSTLQRRPPDAMMPEDHERWCRGWDAAGLEAARTLRQTRAVQAEAKTVRDTLDEAGRLLRRIDGDWIKKPAGIKGAIAQARVNINNCLVRIPGLDVTPAVTADPVTPPAGPEGSDTPAA